MRDPYFYDDCEVLKNKLDIRDAKQLDRAETDISCNAIHRLAVSPLPGNYDFAHFCEMHRHIFHALYEWAGSPRTVPMEKAEAVLGYMSIEYAQPERISAEGEAVLKRMNSREWGKMDLPTQAKFLAADTADLWKVHSFREGNTRTTITFMCQFADSHYMPIERELFEKNAHYVRNALVAATAVFADADFRKPEFLEKIVRDGLERGAYRRKPEKPQDKARSLDEWREVIRQDREKQGRTPGAGKGARQKEQNPGHSDR